MPRSARPLPLPPELSGTPLKSAIDTKDVAAAANKRGTKYFRFLDLPAELRERIYELLEPRGSRYNSERDRFEVDIGLPGIAVDEDGEPCSRLVDELPNRGGIAEIPALMAAVCRKIRNEGLPAYFKYTHFVIHINGNKTRDWPLKWLAAQDGKAVAKIQNFEFRSHKVQQFVPRFPAPAPKPKFMGHEDRIVVDIHGAVVEANPVRKSDFLDINWMLRLLGNIDSFQKGNPIDSVCHCKHVRKCRIVAKKLDGVIGKLRRVRDIPRLSKTRFKEMMKIAIDGMDSCETLQKE